jgi:hypothetical protein
LSRSGNLDESVKVREFSARRRTPHLSGAIQKR